MNKSMKLPFGIEITVNNGSGTIESNLKDEGCLWEKGDGKTAKARAEGMADAIESLLLALACAGVDVQTPQFAEALNTSVESLANSF